VTVSPVVITALIAVLTVTVNATVAFTVKFAPDAASAKKQLKSVALRALEWALNCAIVASLLHGLFASGPVTRAAVLQIAMGVGTILFIVTSKFLMRVLQLQGRMIDASKEHFAITKDLAQRIPPGDSQTR